MKKLNLILALLLAISLAAPNLTASAALPAGRAWTPYPGNPVVTGAVCPGAATPARPAVLVEAPGVYKMYFTTHPGFNGAQIYLADSTDGGLTWICANGGSPVLAVGGAGAWDETRVATPTVVKVAPGDYRMWFTGRSAAAEYAIGYATSPDGVAWTKHPGNPVLVKGGPAAWDASIVREPAVVQFGGQFHMWYSGTARWPFFRIGHAVSPDGISWTKDPANPVLMPTAATWDAAMTYAPSVVVNGADLEMFYSGANGNRWITGHASSPDGVSWTKDANAILAPSAAGWDNADSADYVAGLLDGSDWKLFYSGAGAGGYQIGLLTLQPQAQFTFRQLISTLAVGATQEVYIDLNAVTNLYGYQFEVHYDPTKVSAAGAFVNSFFDTSGSGAVPPGWNAVCAAGVCRFAATLVAAAPVSGSGPLAKITFTGLAAGDTTLAFHGDLLSDRDANALAHTATTGYLTVYGSATVAGAVKLQGRLTPGDAGTVTFYHDWGLFPPVTVNFSAADGSFTALVPVEAGGSTYSALAAHLLYLSNELTGQTFLPGGSYTMATTTLKGGDANNDGRITLPDLTCIGGDFGGAPGTCGGLGSTDINRDGAVNIFDLVLPGGNYSLATPQTW